MEEYGTHLEEIFENSFDYIYLHDKQGNIIDVNNMVVKNLGYSKEEIMKMKVTDFINEEISSRISDEIIQTFETGVVNIPRMYKVKKKMEVLSMLKLILFLLRKMEISMLFSELDMK